LLPVAEMPVTGRSVLGPTTSTPLPPLLLAVIPVSTGVRTMAAVTSAVPSVIRSQSPGGTG